jgi:UDPglucose 6-dehydrogenase
MANIGIIGYGYVGKAVEYGFKDKHRIFINDISMPTLSPDEVVKEADMIFICVPTPMDTVINKIDLSIVDQVFGNLVRISRNLKKEPIIVVKSTIIPGSTRNLAKKYRWLQTLFNPEFLTEANYLEDFVNADRIVIGGDTGWVRQKLVDLYRESFPKIPIFQTDPTTAEMVKYMANAYLAMKVIFANEMSEMCGKLGIKYEEVKQMVVADTRIFNSHLDVTSEKGFGGKCFPKDMVALLGLARELGVDLSVLEAVWKKNLKIRKVRDWEDIPGAVSRQQPEK